MRSSLLSCPGYVSSVIKITILPDDSQWYRMIYTNRHDQHVLKEVEAICEVDKEFKSMRETTVYRRKMKSTFIDDIHFEGATLTTPINYQNITSTHKHKSKEASGNDSESLFSKDSDDNSTNLHCETSLERRDMIQECFGPFQQQHLDKQHSDKEEVKVSNKNKRKRKTTRSNKKRKTESNPNPIKGWKSTIDPPIEDASIAADKRKTESISNPIKGWKSTINPPMEEVSISSDKTLKDDFEEIEMIDSYESLKTNITVKELTKSLEKMIQIDSVTNKKD